MRPFVVSSGACRKGSTKHVFERGHFVNFGMTHANLRNCSSIWARLTLYRPANASMTKNSCTAHSVHVVHRTQRCGDVMQAHRPARSRGLRQAFFLVVRLTHTINFGHVNVTHMMQRSAHPCSVVTKRVSLASELEEQVPELATREDRLPAVGSSRKRRSVCA